MLNFGASKPRVRGGARAPGAPPWIRGWRAHEAQWWLISLTRARYH